MAIITVTDLDGNTKEYSNLSQLKLTQDSYTNIQIEDEESGIINLDNGTRFTYGEARGNGSWICVQGLWMYYENRNFIANSLGGQATQPSNKIKDVSKIYNKFVLENYSMTDDFENRISRGEATLVTTPSDNNKAGTLTIERNGTTDITYKGLFGYTWCGAGQVTHYLTITNCGVFFQVKEIFGPNKIFKNGYALVTPRWISLGLEGENIVCGGAATLYNNTWYGYDWRSFDSSVKKDNTDETSTAGGVSGGTFVNGYIPILFTGIQNNLLSTGSIYIPFANEAEYAYATGITDIFTKISVNELKNLASKS